MFARPLLIGVVAAVVLASASARAEWIVDLQSAGPLSIGMKLGQVNRALRDHLAAPAVSGADPSGRCFQVSPADRNGVALLFFDGVLVRIDIVDSSIRTTSGIGLGDPVEAVHRVYGSKIKSEAHAYDNEGRYLTVASNHGKRGIRFEIADGMVSKYYVGTFEAIHYVEGCA